MKQLIIDGAQIKALADLGEVLVNIIDPEAKSRGHVEDDLDAIRDDIWQIEQLGYTQVKILHAEQLRSALGVDATIEYKNELLETSPWKVNRDHLAKEIRLLRENGFGQTLYDMLVSFLLERRNMTLEIEP